ncbi:hypothetical protein Glove_133g8 [Diversispora epigaea]|uniref:Uncharacterized protein n=1 Tax=Diversispora epigaea TaxID=1348612 RepID=A0A397J191_9GLOM|nr:hypothetical protein Glove_133g8 [Diversispora epigaea]
MFHSCECTDVTPYHRKLSKIEFWKLFKKSLHSNKCGAEGCIRILSIIAEGFSISKLKKNLSIGSDMITNAHKHARLYRPDHANIAQSSYKVDSKSNLPICYLRDQKSELWKKFEETYPNGMKKTLFMVRLANTTLCQICNDYEFEPFENLESIDIILTRIDQLKRHMRRGYEEELKINFNGIIIYDSCISYCLLYAFGDCDQIQKLEEIQEKLKYYLSHQTRKVYLNAQFKPMLNSLDNNGAIIICNYKIRVLSKSARETKSEFFEPGEAKTIIDSHHAAVEPGEAKTIIDSHHAAVGTSISYVIKRYIQVGYDIATGEDIVMAKEQSADWPINNDKEGYICIRTLPGIGKFINFSPSHIANLCNENIVRLQPLIPNGKYLLKQYQIFFRFYIIIKYYFTNPEFKENIINNKERQLIISIDTDFPLNKGWTLKGNQKLGMQNELSLFVESGEISKEDIPKVLTIQNWIATFSRTWKTQATEQYLY